jgi:hypothetical protein
MAPKSLIMKVGETKVEDTKGRNKPDISDLVSKSLASRRLMAPEQPMIAHLDRRPAVFESTTEADVLFYFLRASADRRDKYEAVGNSIRTNVQRRASPYTEDEIERMAAKLGLPLKGIKLHQTTIVKGASVKHALYYDTPLPTSCFRPGSAFDGMKPLNDKAAA